MLRTIPPKLCTWYQWYIIAYPYIAEWRRVLVLLQLNTGNVSQSFLYSSSKGEVMFFRLHVSSPKLSQSGRMSQCRLSHDLVLTSSIASWRHWDVRYTYCLCLFICWLYMRVFIYFLIVLYINECQHSVTWFLRGYQAHNFTEQTHKINYNFQTVFI
jgi:hypothetical protein